MANWFVGLPFEVGTWYKEWAVDVPRSIRVFHPADLHITVAFFGSIGEQRARAGWEAGRYFSSSPIEATLGSLHLLGKGARATAVSFELRQGFSQLKDLIQERRNVMLGAAGLPADNRGVLPHITVGRLSRRASASERSAAKAWMPGVHATGDRVLVDRVALYTWSQDRRQRQFTIIEETSIGRPV